MSRRRESLTRYNYTQTSQAGLKPPQDPVWLPNDIINIFQSSEPNEKF